MPSGLARSSSPPEKTKPAAAACIAALLQKSLLEIAHIVDLLGELKKCWLELPPGSTFRLYELLCGIGVNNFQIGAIPKKSLSRARCDISQKQSLSDQA